MDTSVILKLFFILIIESAALVAEDLCPHPDNKSDSAVDERFSRPPAGISLFNVTKIEPYKLEVNWSDPIFTFTDLPTTICHFNLNISYIPPQKGSHHRTTHMNIDSSRRDAVIGGLTPDTNVTILLSTCLLMLVNESGKLPRSKDKPQGYICTNSVEVTQQTAPNPDRCPAGYYNNTENTCAPCECSNKTKLCESKTGVCLDCLEGSDGKHCEKCVQGYVMKNRICEPAGPSYPLHTFSSTDMPSGIPQSSVTPTTSSTQTTQQTDVSASSTESRLSTSLPAGDVKPVPISIIITAVLVAVAVISCAILLIYKKRGWCKKKPVQFWTIQLQADSQPSVAYSDILEPQHCSREDQNKLIENDFTARLNENQFASDENPYRPVTA